MKQEKMKPIRTYTTIIDGQKVTVRVFPTPTKDDWGTGAQPTADRERREFNHFYHNRKDWGGDRA